MVADALPCWEIYTRTGTCNRSHVLLFLRGFTSIWIGISPLTLKTAGNGSYSFESNPYSWNEVAHVVFVEQPIR